MSNVKKINVRLLTILAVFTAIEIIFCFTPLGSLPLGPGIVATLAHIPAIIIAVVLGKKPALYMGVIMGICAFVWWSTIGIAYPAAFAFTPFAPYGNIFSLIICIVPRVIFPVIAAWIFEKLRDKIKTVPAAALAAVISSLVHSILVLSLIYICFVGNSKVSEMLGDDYIKFLIAWGGVNATAEIIVAGVVSAATALPLIKITKRV